MWLTKPQDSTVSRKDRDYEEADYVFWDPSMWQKVKVLAHLPPLSPPRTSIVLI